MKTSIVCGALAASLLLVSGCASRPVDLRELSATPPYVLCYNVIRGNYQGGWLHAANSELVSRGETCAAYLPAISVRLQSEAENRQANAAIGLQMLQRPAVVQQRPVQTNCHSVLIGNRMDTICY